MRFKIDIAQDVIDRIMARVAAVQWPDTPGGAAPWQYGADIAYMKELVAYWRTKFDWRACEREMNRWPHFKTRIDDLDIHYIYEKGSGEKPQPLFLTHGWPGSFVEFSKVIEPLAHPERFGGDEKNAFDVVVASLPGYGFSQKPNSVIGPRRIAQYFDKLLTEHLGIEGYIAQGGDWGSMVTAFMALEGRGCKAVSQNMYGWLAQTPPQTKDELAAAGQFMAVLQAEGGYVHQQSTKPVTLSYAMADSPVGVAAWIIEKFRTWSDLDNGDIESIYTKDDLLANIMVYLVTETFASASWIYLSIGGGIDEPVPPGTRITRPYGATVGNDIYAWPPRSLVERGVNLVRWSEIPKGGHFLAAEQPEVFVDELQAFNALFR